MQPIYESNSDDNQGDIETASSTSSLNKMEKLKSFFQGSSIQKI